MKISVITVCYNNAKGLTGSLKSVLEQENIGKDVEMIVVDGKSTDNTLEVLEKYKKIFATEAITFKFQSELDKGIYDAMNKGAQTASGEWCIYLNAGDVFFDKGVLSSFLQIINTRYDFIYGDAILRYQGKCKAVYASDDVPTKFLRGGVCSFATKLA